MIYAFCTACSSREAHCALPDSHRAQSKIVWKADFLLGGRYGNRIRKTFAVGITKKEAEKFERQTITDFEREKITPGSGAKSKTNYMEFLVLYENHIRLHMRGAEEEIYRLTHSKDMWKDRPLHTIGANEIEAYIQRRLNDGIKKSTVNREITVLKCAFNWAVKKNYCAQNPCDGVQKFKLTDSIRQRWLTDQEIQLLIDGARVLKDFDLEDLIVVGLNCGFRKDNLERLEAKHILGSRLHAEKTKSGKDYDVPINETLRAKLEKLVRMRAPGRLLNFDNLRRRWDRLIKFTGMYLPSRNPNNVTIHTLRHTYVAQSLRRGVPIDVVCKWAGHYSMEFTRKHYGHLCPLKEDEYIRQVELGSTEPVVKEAV